jgi:hypothetical protein
MDPARQHTQLLDRLLQLGQGLGERGGGGRVGAIAVTQHRQGQGQGRQPLLGPVVQVPFHATALAVPRLHDPLARCPDLLQLGSHLSVQPRVFDRHPGRRGSAADEPLVERGIVDQRRKRPPLPLHQRDRACLVPLPGLRQRFRLPAGGHPPVLPLPRVQQLQRRITKGTAERCLQVSRGERPVQLHHQIADRTTGQAG